MYNTTIYSKVDLTNRRRPVKITTSEVSTLKTVQYSKTIFEFRAYVPDRYLWHIGCIYGVPKTLQKPFPYLMFSLDLFNFSTPSHLENRSIKMSTRKGHQVRGDIPQTRVFIFKLVVNRGFRYIFMYIIIISSYF